MSSGDVDGQTAGAIHQQIHDAPSNGTRRGDMKGTIDDVIYLDWRSLFGPLQICYCMNALVLGA